MKTKNYYFNIKGCLDVLGGYEVIIVKKTTWDREKRWDETGINDNYLVNIGFSRLAECEYESDWSEQTAKEMLQQNGFIYNSNI